MMPLVCPGCKQILLQRGDVANYHCTKCTKEYKSKEDISDFLTAYDEELVQCYDNEANLNYASENYLSSKRQNLFYRKRMESILSLISKNEIEGKTLLDAGCGCGVYSLQFCKWNAKVFCIDIAKNYLKNTIKLCKTNNTPVMGAYRANLEELPFSDDFFDIVFCSEVVEHLRKPEKALLEMKRVLKNCGLLMITIPSKYSLVEKQRKDTQHLQSYSPAEFGKMLKGYGFEIERTKSAVYISYFLRSYLERSNFLYKLTTKAEDILPALPFLKVFGWCFIFKARNIK